MDLQPTLSPLFAVYIRNYLLDRGVDPEAVFEEFGLPATSVGESAAPIPVPIVAQLFEAAAQRTKDSCVGLNIARQYHYESASLLILAMLAAPSVEEGLKLLCRYDRYLDTGIETGFRTGSDTAEFSANLLDPTGSRTDQLNEYLMSFIVQSLTMATRKPMPVTEVWFRHSHGSDEIKLERFFKAPIKYSQTDNKLFFDRAYLGERFFTTNNILCEVLTNALRTYFSVEGDHTGFIAAVCREVIRQTQEEAPGIEEVADALSISGRTLRRRLADEGYSYQEVKNLVREQRAKYYLSGTSMPLVEIALELGYSELSAFSRAFRGWAGMTPQSYREKVQQLL